jgi:repressor LexA
VFDLTERQETILGFIREYINKNGYPPTVREIATGAGLHSPATVHRHLKNLEDLGLFTRHPSKPRTIEMNV